MSLNPSESLAIPLFGPGTRVEVAREGCTLLCRLARMQGRMLHLTVSGDGVAIAPQLPPGEAVQLTLYRGGACWEARATIREWLWTRPPILVAGPVLDWQEKPRRQALRTRRQVDIRLHLEDGQRFYGRTLDISAAGLSLLLGGDAPLAEGDRAQATFQLSEDEWVEAIPIRITRRENWLHARGRSLRIGATVEAAPGAPARAPWLRTLRRLGIEEGE